MELTLVPHAFASSILELEVYNNSIPFAKLPDDVLLMVFKNAMYFQCRSRILQFSFVCRRWRRAILNNASYWNDVTIHADNPSVSSQLQLAKLCLIRANNAALRFTLYYRCNTTSWKIPVSSSPVLDLLVSNIARITHLSLALTPHTLPLLARLSAHSPATNLKTLFISSGVPRRSGKEYSISADQTAMLISRLLTASIEGFPLFADDFPDLQSLSLSRFHVPCKSTIYNGLTALSLEGLPVLEPLEGFTDALRRAPHLKTLKISFSTRAVGNRFTRTSAGPLPLLSLAQLSDLALNRVTVADLEIFFAHISAPSLILLDVTVSVYSGVPTARLVDILTALPTHIRGQLCTVMELCVGNRDLQHLSFTLPQLKDSKVTISVYDKDASQPPSFAFDAVLRLFPSIEHLELIAELGDSLKAQVHHSPRIATLSLYRNTNASTLEELHPGGHLASVRALCLYNIPIMDTPLSKAVLSSDITTLKILGAWKSSAIGLVDIARQRGIEVHLSKLLVLWCPSTHNTSAAAGLSTL